MIGQFAEASQLSGKRGWHLLSRQRLEYAADEYRELVESAGMTRSTPTSASTFRG